MKKSSLANFWTYLFAGFAIVNLMRFMSSTELDKASGFFTLLDIAMFLYWSNRHTTYLAEEAAAAKAPKETPNDQTGA